MDGVTVYAARDAAEQVGVLSFNLDGREPEKTADALAQRGFALRGGLHCAPYAHRTAGTLPNGTVRLSCLLYTSGAGGEHAHPVQPRQRHCDGVRRVRGESGTLQVRKGLL